jgi:Spy/CpxP family protein refolding chaperone
MKINKLTMAIMMAGSLLAISPAVHAQSTNSTGNAATTPRRGRGRLTLEAIDKAVTLTDAEKPKVKDALDSYTTAMTDAMNADQDERASKMRAARQDLDTKMKGILTPDQYTKFQPLLKGGRRGAGAGGAGGGATPPPANSPAGN